MILLFIAVTFWRITPKDFVRDTRFPVAVFTLANYALTVLLLAYSVGLVSGTRTVSVPVP
jgi:hypothetical protein